jgi:phosphohistidine phosphatase
VRRLIIMRHAKADRSSASGGDFDRPLTIQGRLDAALVAKALADAGLIPDLALVSAALRTRETWDEAAKFFPNTRLVLNHALYNAEDQQLRRSVADEDDNCQTLLLIAHNPGVHALAARLLMESSAAPSVIDKVQASFPPATAVAFQIDEGGRAHYDGLFLVKALGGAGD